MYFRSAKSIDLTGMVAPQVVVLQVEGLDISASCCVDLAANRQEIGHAIVHVEFLAAADQRRVG